MPTLPAATPLHSPGRAAAVCSLSRGIRRAHWHLAAVPARSHNACTLVPCSDGRPAHAPKDRSCLPTRPDPGIGHGSCPPPAEVYTIIWSTVAAGGGRRAQRALECCAHACAARYACPCPGLDRRRRTAPARPARASGAPPRAAGARAHRRALVPGLLGPRRDTRRAADAAGGEHLRRRLAGRLRAHLSRPGDRSGAGADTGGVPAGRGPPAPSDHAFLRPAGGRPPRWRALRADAVRLLAAVPPGQPGGLARA